MNVLRHFLILNAPTNEKKIIRSVGIGLNKHQLCSIIDSIYGFQGVRLLLTFLYLKSCVSALNKL